MNKYLIIFLSLLAFSCKKTSTINPSGPIWTQNSLNDPNNAYSFTPILVDKNDIIWLSGAFNGFTECGYGTFTNDKITGMYNKSNSNYPGGAYPEGTLNQMQEDLSGNKWCQINGSIYKFDGQNWTLIPSPPAPVLDAGWISINGIDNQGRVWASTGSGPNLFRYENGNWTTIYTPPNSDFNYFGQLRWDKNGTFWIGTGFNSIGYIVNDSVRFIKQIITTETKDTTFIESPRDFVNDKDGNLWVGSNNGMYLYDGKDWKFHFTKNNSGLPDNDIMAATCDKSGSLWIGTYNGIVKYSNATWTLYNPPSLNSHIECSWIGVNSKNEKWFETNGGFFKLTKE